MGKKKNKKTDDQSNAPAQDKKGTGDHPQSQQQQPRQDRPQTSGSGSGGTSNQDVRVKQQQQLQQQQSQQQKQKSDQGKPHQGNQPQGAWSNIAQQAPQQQKQQQQRRPEPSGPEHRSQPQGAWAQNPTQKQQGGPDHRAQQGQQGQGSGGAWGRQDGRQDRRQDGGQGGRQDERQVGRQDERQGGRQGGRQESSQPGQQRNQGSGWPQEGQQGQGSGGAWGRQDKRQDGRQEGRQGGRQDERQGGRQESSQPGQQRNQGSGWPQQGQQGQGAGRQDERQGGRQESSQPGQQRNQGSGWPQEQGAKPKSQPQQQPQSGGSARSTPPQDAQKAVGQTSKDVKSLAGNFEKMEIQKYDKSVFDIVSSTNQKCGTRGIKTRVETNFVDLNLNNLLPAAYHYDIRFDPDKPKNLMPTIFQNFRTKYFPNVPMAFDGRNSVYSASLVKLDKEMEAEINYKPNDTDRDRIYKVKFKEAINSKIDLTQIKKFLADTKAQKPATLPLRAVQAVEVILRMAFQGKSYVVLNRSSYIRPQKPVDLGDGYELWNGLYQSFVLGSKPYLNIDVVNKGFPAPVSVIDILMQLNANPQRDVDDFTLNKLNLRLKGLNVCYSASFTSPKIYKYNGLKGSADREVFVLDDGKKSTVREYFAKRYNYQLKYPNFPCLWVGNTIKNIYLPAEFCYIQGGQALMKKLNELQTRNMIRYSATSTDERKRNIMNMLYQVQHNNTDVIKKFGINIGDRFQELDARIISAPALEYRNSRLVNVKEGVWNAESEHFLDAKSLTNWAILKLDDRFPDNIISTFSDMVVNIGSKMNMNINKTCERLVLSSRARDQEIDNVMTKLKAKRVEIVFVVIPTFNDAYAKVKQSAELRCGMLTQCVKTSTLDKRLTPSTVSNILLKVNSKLNGTNHRINKGHSPPLMYDNCMIVGADVTHPAGDFSDPSVAGVAASHDANAFQYNICWRLQDPKQEMIKDLKNIIKDQLNFYKSKNNKFPSKILYFRDGVSDGQFQEVLDTELTAIYAACGQVQMDYKPKVSFIVVQKRHHTRFFPAKGTRGCGKHNNVSPGTVVDTDITNPQEYQFYLVSHASIQGVAKPTKYCVLWDDSNIAVDALQAITYNLCHLFTRCNRTVSYVAPTYYAHHAAARGKVYVTNARINLRELDREFNKRQIREDIVHGYPMFFV